VQLVFAHLNNLLSPHSLGKSNSGEIGTKTEQSRTAVIPSVGM